MDDDPLLTAGDDIQKSDGYVMGLTLRHDQPDGTVKYTHKLIQANFIYQDMLSHHIPHIRGLIVAEIEGESGKATV